MKSPMWVRRILGWDQTEIFPDGTVKLDPRWKTMGYIDERSRVTYKETFEEEITPWTLDSYTFPRRSEQFSVSLTMDYREFNTNLKSLLFGIDWYSPEGMARWDAAHPLPEAKWWKLNDAHLYFWMSPPVPGRLLITEWNLLMPIDVVDGILLTHVPIDNKLYLLAVYPPVVGDWVECE